MDTKKEAKRKKALGELGELFAIKALVDCGFTNIKNLNDKKRNFPFADIYAENEGNKYIISIKTRNKFQRNNKENLFYNLGQNAYKNAKKAENEYNALAYWMAIQIDTNSITIFLGSLKEIYPKNKIPISLCKNNKIGKCLKSEIRHYFDWDFFENKKSKV